MTEPVELCDLPPQTRRAGPPRVLIVDDDPSFLELAAAALEGEGFAVSLARTPCEALMSAVHTPPDVILLDILLPGSDGLDVLDALRSEPETRAVPVLACTALGERASAAHLTSLGFDGVLTKPLNLLEFARELRAKMSPRVD